MPAESDPPQNPPIKSFLDTIREMYPDEFSNKPITLKQQLQDADAIIATEENHLDKPPQRRSRVPSDSLDEAIQADYRDYKDNKRWLDED